MNQMPAAADSVAATAESAAARRETMRSRLAALARTIIAACGGTACVVAWRDAHGDQFLCAPAGARWRGALGATFAAITRQLEAFGAPGCSLHLNSAQLVPLLAGAVANHQRFDAVATSAIGDSNRVMVIIVAPHGRVLAELEAIVGLAANHALAMIAADNDSRRRNFWRQRAVATAGSGPRQI